jgi:hypothetical protein
MRRAPGTHSRRNAFTARNSLNRELQSPIVAFPFRTLDNNLDFVLIPVHLQPGDSSRDAARRKEELDTIAAWIDSHGAVEHDFIIVGDMNIEDAEELASATPAGFRSLNDECRPTNTNVNAPKPYDHVMFSTTYTGEIDQSYDMVVVDLVDAVRDKWTGTEPFPGAPYNHNEFRKHFSDHSPVVFHVTIPAADDDVAVIATTTGLQ